MNNTVYACSNCKLLYEVDPHVCIKCGGKVTQKEYGSFESAFYKGNGYTFAESSNNEAVVDIKIENEEPDEQFSDFFSDLRDFKWKVSEQRQSEKNDGYQSVPANYSFEADAADKSSENDFFNGLPDIIPASISDGPVEGDNEDVISSREQSHTGRRFNFTWLKNIRWGSIAIVLAVVFALVLVILKRKLILSIIINWFWGIFSALFIVIILFILVRRIITGRRGRRFF